jgi:hypothetical protein
MVQLAKADNTNSPDKAGKNFFIVINIITAYKNKLLSQVSTRKSALKGNTEQEKQTLIDIAFRPRYVL